MTEPAGFLQKLHSCVCAVRRSRTPIPIDGGNLALIDWQPDGQIDLLDGICPLHFLFGGGKAHPLAVPGAETTECVGTTAGAVSGGGLSTGECSIQPAFLRNVVEIAPYVRRAQRV